MVSGRLRAAFRPRPGGGALLLGGLLAALAGGCASGGGAPVRTLEVPFSPDEQALWASAREARYQLRAGDVFGLDFKYQDELDQQNIPILPDGHITLPGMTSIAAAGLNVDQLDSLLTARYSVDYVNPELSIMMRELGDQQIYVFGEVERPGGYPLPPRMGSLMQAISMAGGFTEDASKGQVLLVRVTPQGYLYRLHDLSHLEKMPLASALQLDLQPYDVVYVPRGALGDLRYFNSTVLRSVLDLSGLFWDIYAISNLDKVDRLVR